MVSGDGITSSPAINDAMRKAAADDIGVDEISTGWTKVRADVRMQKPLTSSLRAALIGDPRLRYWSWERSPHNEAEEGFVDDQAKVGISFPLAAQPSEKPQKFKGPLYVLATFVIALLVIYCANVISAARF